MSQHELKMDWQEVVDLDPQGYVEINNGIAVVHGPIKSVRINEDDFVEIELKWRARVDLDEVSSLPKGEWEVTSNDEPITFPNLIIHFIIEETPEKGPRVRFHNTHILYINPVEGLDPTKVKGLNLEEVEG